jgi:hypothetical protein
LVLVFASAVAGIVDVLWGLEFSFLFPVALVALLLQWLLAAAAPVSHRLAAALGAVLGVEYVVISAGRLGDLILLCWREVFRLLGALLVWLWQTLGALCVADQWECMKSGVGEEAPMGCFPHCVPWGWLFCGKSSAPVGAGRQGCNDSRRGPRLLTRWGTLVWGMIWQCTGAGDARLSGLLDFTVGDVLFGISSPRSPFLLVLLLFPPHLDCFGRTSRARNPRIAGLILP